MEMQFAEHFSFGKLIRFTLPSIEYITARGYSAVRDIVGHGVGANLHEAP